MYDSAAEGGEQDGIQITQMAQNSRTLLQGKRIVHLSTKNIPSGKALKEHLTPPQTMGSAIGMKQPYSG